MSSGSESDEEFVPGEPENLSEEESADEETDLQYQKEQDHKAKKRKAIQETKAKSKKKIRTRNSVIEVAAESEDDEENNLEPVNINPVEEKKREDDLWAMFLDGTETKPKSAANDSLNTPNKSDKQDPAKNKLNIIKKSDELAQNSAREKRIFEFAGEAIVVEDNVIKEKIKKDNASLMSQADDTPIPSRSSGGLSSVLEQLNKKNQLTTLEKSKLDWNTYKKETGIEEEVKSHNKGKDGFLERRDFLERADLRQYEIERDLRMSRRSNR